jgi:isopropylmalate/homocitrate/citramalate synthase
VTGHRSLSPYNDRLTRLTGGVDLLVNDCTLREGEQSALVNIRPDQKVRLAEALAAAGLRQIQVGYPGLSRTDLDVFRRLRERGVGAALEAVVLGYLPSWREQVQACVEAGADVVTIVYVTSPPRREHIFRASKADVRERSRALVELAKASGLTVSFAPADTTRTELDFALEMVALAAETGADRIFVADTLGAAAPGAVRWLIGEIRGVTSLPIQFHGHNDFGLALANALGAAEAGAAIIDATLNGWGDRTGNPPTEELVAALELLYRNPVGIDLAAIARLAREAAAELGVPVSPMKPVTGALAFAHKLETHVKAVLTHPPAFEPYDPALVGGSRHVAIGQYSGPEAVAARLATLGLAVPAAALPGLVERVREAARATNRVLSDDDLRALAAAAGAAGERAGARPGDTASPPTTRSRS